MRAPQDQGVDPGRLHRLEVLPRHPEQLVPTGDPGLDELHEPRTRAADDRDARCGGECVDVRAAAVGARRGDHADEFVAGGGRGPTHGRPDHLDDRHVVALTGIVQHRRAGRVARDDQRLDAAVDQGVQTLQRVPARLRDGPGTVGRPGRVAEVGDGFVGELVQHGASHREPPYPESKMPIGESCCTFAG
ncbi:hypothetical protein GCM10025883_10950 [Mobilicoccus caccae]|uniref:Uncharacterized protein n=1 Tax=Mobilicoccus caccae TaxID=1859295 RepID=A0ABQ6IM99_9MICO|nr:hypothetical protein GCM10025883_10950 [Mobilicoccus caccae]